MSNGGPVDQRHPVPENDAPPRILIIGAGISGIIMAIRLLESGIASFRILEKADEVGGVWRDNIYPGIRCDVPSAIFRYSSEPPPQYSERFPCGEEIRNYLHRVAESHHLHRYIDFGIAVKEMVFDGHRWNIRCADGSERTAEIVIAASGVLNRPRYPEISGRDQFSGASFHTARWDHNVSLAGKRVGVIGTGSTAVQLVSAIASDVTSLTLFQRTAQWVLPLPNRRYSVRHQQRLTTLPIYGTCRKLWYTKAFQWTFGRAFLGSPLLQRLAQRQCQRYLESTVPDEALRQKLQPTYQAGCKRLVMGQGYYEALMRPHVHLETTSIDSIQPDGVLTEDGSKHSLDVLIYATGYHAQDFVRPLGVRGRDGLSLDTAWGQGVYSHRSVAIPGFPNFFMFTGPYSPLGNYSTISIAEVQANYIGQLIRPIVARDFELVEPKTECCTKLLRKMRRALKRTVWVSGCQSWYLDEHGDPPLWPWTFERFARELRHVKTQEYLWSHRPRLVKLYRTRVSGLQRTREQSIELRGNRCPENEDAAIS